MNQDNKIALEHIKNLIKKSDIYPPDADYRPVSDNDQTRISIDWGLKDTERPSKLSKRIEISLSHTFLSDYNNLVKDEKKRIDGEIISSLKHNYSNFDPNHNNSEKHNPPVKKLQFQFIIKMIKGHPYLQAELVDLDSEQLQFNKRA